MRTPICDQLGIEFPILAFSHCRDVVAAVSKAGGLGVLGAVAHSPERLEQELDWIEEHNGGKPYGVDLLVPATYIGNEEGGLGGKKLAGMIPEEHRAFVNGLMEKYGVPPLPEGGAPERERRPAVVEPQGRQAAARRRPVTRRRPPHRQRPRPRARVHGRAPPTSATCSSPASSARSSTPSAR